MSVIPVRTAARNDYPTWSPEVPESELHRDRMLELIEVLRTFYEGTEHCASGDLLVFYEPDNRRRHVSPDVFVARGVGQMLRRNYLVWEEARGPEFIIEVTSASTAANDRTTKFELYRDVLKVREYFLFDPEAEYLDPPLQGFRLRAGQYQPIRPRDGRLPSQVTGLHLEVSGTELRLWNPGTGQWLPTKQERLDEAREHIEQQDEQLAAKDAEIERLRRELERRGSP